MDVQSIFRIGFFVFVAIMLVLDLGVFNKKAHEIKTKEAMIRSCVWILLALGFAGCIWYFLGHAQGLEFVTAYLIEKSLSIDNLFVFIMIFAYFKIDKLYQHKILFRGILGAMVMRGLFLWLGLEILDMFHRIIYIFGGMLVRAGYKMVRGEEEEEDFSNKPIVRVLRKFLPIVESQHGFFTRMNGKLAATTLFVALLVVEVTDLVFAVDSIPAVLSISNNMFVVYTSNIFAILGLRSLYFALASVIDKFVYLKYGIAVILGFVGVKMLISGFFHIPVLISLGVILACLVIPSVRSVLYPPVQDGEHT